MSRRWLIVYKLITALLTKYKMKTTSQFKLKWEQFMILMTIVENRYTF